MARNTSFKSVGHPIYERYNTIPCYNHDDHWQRALTAVKVSMCNDASLRKKTVIYIYIYSLCVEIPGEIHSTSPEFSWLHVKKTHDIMFESS